MTRILTGAPRWLLVASLVFAPWAYGSVRPWAMQSLCVLANGLWILWLMECLLHRRLPKVPAMALMPALGLILEGWWMAFNAHSFFDNNLGALLPETSILPRVPGSADGPASISGMYLFTGLLGVFLFCCELAQDSVWRRRIWATMVLTGLSIAILGILQKLVGDPLLALTWESAKRDITNNFATFRYRGNAGAYLNLILPLMAGVTFLAFRRDDRPWRKAFWVAALFILILGIQLNPSRSSWVIAWAILLFSGVKILSPSREKVDGSKAKRGWTIALGAGLILLGIGAISLLGDWETSWNRISILGFDIGDRSPVVIYLRMIPDAGMFGFGPGTFGVVFPSYQETYDFGNRVVPVFWKEGFFAHAHEDYLETLIEWGYLGTFLWSILLTGGITQGVRRYRQRQTSSSSRWLLFGCLLGLGGVLTQAFVDFPLQIASIQLYVFVLLGICWGSGASTGDHRSSINS